LERTDFRTIHQGPAGNDTGHQDDSAQSAALSPKSGASSAVPIEDWENCYRESLPSPPHRRYDPSSRRSRRADACPCVAEFGKLREDVQKCGLAAKAASQYKVSRGEMCKHITAYTAAELKWVK